jgi:hypothetical protein
MAQPFIVKFEFSKLETFEGQGKLKWSACCLHCKETTTRSWDHGVLEDCPRPRENIEDKVWWPWPGMWCLRTQPSMCNFLPMTSHKVVTSTKPAFNEHCGRNGQVSLIAWLIASSALALKVSRIVFVTLPVYWQKLTILNLWSGSRQMMRSWYSSILSSPCVKDQVKSWTLETNTRTMKDGS